MKRALVACLLAACGDPDAGGCFLDNLGTRATGCAVPTADITIDGLIDDWDALPPQQRPPCDDCGLTDVVNVRSAYTPDRRIVFLLQIEGGPSERNGDHYTLNMFPLSGPQFRLSVDVRGDDSYRYLNDENFVGLWVAHAYAASAIEIAMWVDDLPFAGGLNLAADREFLDADGVWHFEHAPATLFVCWDRNAPVCRLPPL